MHAHVAAVAVPVVVRAPTHQSVVARHAQSVLVALYSSGVSLLSLLVLSLLLFTLLMVLSSLLMVVLEVLGVVVLSTLLVLVLLLGVSAIFVVSAAVLADVVVLLGWDRLWRSCQRAKSFGGSSPGGRSVSRLLRIPGFFSNKDMTTARYVYLKTKKMVEVAKYHLDDTNRFSPKYRNTRMNPSNGMFMYASGPRIHRGSPLQYANGKQFP